MGGDLLEFAVPEVADVVSGKKNFKTATKSVANHPNDTFAIINTQPSNTPGEHRITIAKFCHELYFADSLGISINNNPFLEQNYSQMVRTRLQDHSSVCGFYTIYTAFHLFKFQQEEITGVHDVNVLCSFISNLM